MEAVETDAESEHPEEIEPPHLPFLRPDQIKGQPEQLPFLRPDQIQGQPGQKPRSEVKTSATSKNNILELINPTTMEYFLGAFLLFALVLYSSNEAESKDEYLLVGNHYDEL